MGIGITSNRYRNIWLNGFGKVSIPNGDRHYLEQEFVISVRAVVGVFQSPMGIGITSNGKGGCLCRLRSGVSIPNGDRHYLEHSRIRRFSELNTSFNPQWG